MLCERPRQRQANSHWAVTAKTNRAGLIGMSGSKKRQHGHVIYTSEKGSGGDAHDPMGPVCEDEQL